MFSRERQMVTRVFTEGMRHIGKAIFPYAKKVFPELKQPAFNHMAALLYGYETILGEHRDTYYSPLGNYSYALNSQAKETPTCILTIGDSRVLQLRLIKYVRGKSGILNKMEAVKRIYKRFILKHGSLFVLHPEDEKPIIRLLFGQEAVKSFYKHGVSVTKVSKNSASIALAFRITNHSTFVNTATGQHYMETDEQEMDEKVYTDNHRVLNDFLNDMQSRSELMEELKTIRRNLLATYFHL